MIKLKGLTGDNKLPKGVLLAGPKAIEACTFVGIDVYTCSHIHIHMCV